MDLNPRQKRNIRITLQLIVFGVSAGVLFAGLSNGLDDFYPLMNGAIIGFLLAVIAAYFELYVYEKGIRKQQFIVLLATRTLFYFFMITVVIVIEIGTARMIKEGLNFSQLLQNEKFNTYIYGGEFGTSVFYTFALSLFVNFNRQMRRKLDPRLLKSLLLGKYYHPVKVRLIFMFVNLRESDLYIEKMGRLKFHYFINEIAYDVATPILSNHGVIYHYVEDEMVVSWSMKQGIKNAHVVRCFFDMKDKIRDLKEKYVQKYGVVPEFNASIHCGEVIKGEIGYIKSEIVYHGDVMNSTSRILGACSKLSKEFLVSARLLKLLQLPGEYTAQKCGDIKLKGKKEAMEIYSISEMKDV